MTAYCTVLYSSRSFTCVSCALNLKANCFHTQEDRGRTWNVSTCSGNSGWAALINTCGGTSLRYSTSHKVWTHLLMVFHCFYYFPHCRELCILLASSNPVKWAWDAFQGTPKVNWYLFLNHSSTCKLLVSFERHNSEGDYVGPISWENQWDHTIKPYPWPSSIKIHTPVLNPVEMADELKSCRQLFSIYGNSWWWPLEAD